jgi:hypothetical protein
VFLFSIFNMIYNILAANTVVMVILLFTLQMIIARIRGQYCTIDDQIFNKILLFTKVEINFMNSLLIKR